MNRAALIEQIQEARKTLEKLWSYFNRRPSSATDLFLTIRVIAAVGSDSIRSHVWHQQPWRRQWSHELRRFALRCQTGERLFDKEHKPVEGREHEIEQLRRGIELLAKGELVPARETAIPSHPDEHWSFTLQEGCANFRYGPIREESALSLCLQLALQTCHRAVVAPRWRAWLSKPSLPKQRHNPASKSNGASSRPS